MSEHPADKPASQSDPLASLHRMSTTAGAASQEYVAINLPAVTALILGLASTLVLLSPFLLVVPAAAIIFAVAAFRQINGSNGTQSGRLLAAVGIVVALTMTGTVGWKTWSEHAAASAHRRAILKTVVAVEQGIVSKNYAGLWEQFSDRFKQTKQITPGEFEARWKQFALNTRYGNIASISTNNRIELSRPRADGTRTGATVLLLNFDSGQVARAEIYLSERQDGWIIEDIPMIFPDPDPSAAR